MKISHENEGKYIELKTLLQKKSTHRALYVKCECHGNSTRIVTGHLHHDKWSCNIWFV